MIKSELVTLISERCKLSKADAKRAVELVFEMAKNELIKGNRVELRGFGVLSVRDRKPRLGRNPKTGAAVQIPGKRIPFFKAGKGIQEALNKKPTA